MFTHTHVCVYVCIASLSLYNCLYFVYDSMFNLRPAIQSVSVKNGLWFFFFGRRRFGFLVTVSLFWHHAITTGATKKNIYSLNYLLFTSKLWGGLSILKKKKKLTIIYRENLMFFSPFFSANKIMFRRIFYLFSNGVVE